MKVAIISLTEKGNKLSKKLKNLLDQDSTIIKTDIYYKNVKKNIPILFYEYEAIIAIMASGILIRNIAPLLKSKLTDPAIINMDENGKFVISLLSGHIGGANDLTLKIANILKSTPVISTATDVNSKIGIDSLAKKFYFNIQNPKEIVYFNKAVLDDDEFTFIINDNFKYLKSFLKNSNLNYKIEIDENLDKGKVIVKIENHKLILEKKKLVLGIGCKKGKRKEEILNAVKKVFKDLSISLDRIDCIATAEIKKNEKGIIDLSKELKIPLKFVTLEKLKFFKSKDCSKSKFVKSKFGIDGVCEQSALIVAGFDSKLIYKKTPFNGVTIAVAISK